MAADTDSAAALLALAGARTWNDVRAAFAAAAPNNCPARDPESSTPAWTWADVDAALMAAVASMGWAVLVAPEIHRIIQLHLAIRRVEADLKSLRRIANRLEREMRDPNVWRVVEVAKERGPGYFAADFGPVEIVTRGPDVLSVRATAAVKASAEAVKAEATLASLGERMDRAIGQYRLTLIRWDTMSPAQRRANLLQIAAMEHALPTAAALLDASPDGAPTDGAAKAMLGNLAKRLGFA